ncbi:DUF2267 domain-containing protein [Streptomonospora litoralis]|uniref:DUF2267 domain-containing protein n=1 Tax=Streptomonospora litoralis TaxID=2498135 RepID=A0A4P6Q2H3_9ACTN|nr:DUF2267 domain-containing protein [Streptomonospora litoralis]QBI52837.1 hypothetical protein EKD16_05150 [Streptomonospora litoralis]
MQHDAFIGQVQDRARLDSRGAAESFTRATLETIAERINPDLADDLAAQLPQEIGENVRRVTDQWDPTERFGQDEFVQRVASRAHSDQPQAAYAARVVFELLDEATTGNVMGKVRQGLPDDLREFTLAGSSGDA